MSKDHSCTAISRDPDPHPAHEVHSEVDDRAPSWRRRDRDRFDLLHGSNGGRDVRSQGREIPLDHDGRLPRTVIEPWLVPAGRLESGVVLLALVEAVGLDGAGGAAGGFAADDRLSAVGVLDLELEEDGRAVDVVVADAFVAQQASGPALPHDGSEDVLSRLEGGCDVVAADSETVPVRSPPGREEFVADFRPIQRRFDDAEGCDMQCRVEDVVTEGEGVTHVECRIAGARRGATADESRLPVVRRHRAPRTLITVMTDPRARMPPETKSRV
ncbi:hypothetical protein CMMCAS02_00675 [Clavibacter michiganensis subsp. michiganensis]|nr:hypothetical protein CMMCAS02_00675 [Clavibacter michiganensis subsp. michiganensis]OUE00112.1 hypothetical protein CMMCAS06_00145 [Clavibacter michiganensis subsp. michiganensis]